LPMNLQDSIVKVLEKEFKGRDNTTGIARMWRHHKNGFLYIKKEVFDYLPVIGLRLDDKPDSAAVKIHPRHYCQNAGTEEVAVFVRYSTVSVLGTPLFRAYRVHVDYTNHKIALLEN
ncbi:hypothetical protein FOZ63_014879, partial [Perkinsus olseni]